MRRLEAVHPVAALLLIAVIVATRGRFAQGTASLGTP
jgi:hypothetical protein